MSRLTEIWCLWFSIKQFLIFNYGWVFKLAMGLNAKLEEFVGIWVYGSSSEKDWWCLQRRRCLFVRVAWREDTNHGKDDIFCDIVNERSSLLTSVHSLTLFAKNQDNKEGVWVERSASIYSILKALQAVVYLHDLYYFSPTLGASLR